MDQHLNKKIDEAMRSLDGLEKASPRPFFFTRLESRMQREKSGWEAISSFVAKPVVAFACICLIIMINAAVILSSANSKNVTDQQNSEQATADEYNSLSAPLYEFVNSTP
jgi:uncharacterized membrane protein YdfJ with MMPL/SSD domain